jgi:hypothetical protein
MCFSVTSCAICFVVRGIFCAMPLCPITITAGPSCSSLPGSGPSSSERGQYPRAIEYASLVFLAQLVNPRLSYTHILQSIQNRKHGLTDSWDVGNGPTTRSTTLQGSSSSSSSALLSLLLLLLLQKEQCSQMMRRQQR